MKHNMITIGNFEIKWYSFFILIAFTIGILLIEREAKKQKLDKTIISNMCFYSIIICILGARIYYVIFNFDYYKDNLIDIFKIWEGGLAIHGGIIAGIIFIYLYTKKHSVKFLKVLDIVSPYLILGQAIGRWGNFFNSEAYGSLTTYKALTNLHIPKFIINGMYINHHYYHPTFFYESIGCLIGFIILLIYKYKIKKQDGEITSIYLIIYGIIRFFIESLRQDSLMLGNMKMAQLVSITMIIIGITLLFILKIRSKNDKQKMGSSTKK